MDGDRPDWGEGADRDSSMDDPEVSTRPRERCRGRADEPDADAKPDPVCGDEAGIGEPEPSVCPAARAVLEPIALDGALGGSEARGATGSETAERGDGGADGSTASRAARSENCVRGVEGSLGSENVTGAVTAEKDEVEMGLGGTGERSCGVEVPRREWPSGVFVSERADPEAGTLVPLLAVWKERSSERVKSDTTDGSSAYRWELSGRAGVVEPESECALRRGEAGVLESAVPNDNREGEGTLSGGDGERGGGGMPLAKTKSLEVRCARATTGVNAGGESERSRRSMSLATRRRLRRLADPAAKRRLSRDARDAVNPPAVEMTASSVVWYAMGGESPFE